MPDSMTSSISSTTTYVQDNLSDSDGGSDEFMVQKKEETDCFFTKEKEVMDPGVPSTAMTATATALNTCWLSHRNCVWWIVVLLSVAVASPLGRSFQNKNGNSVSFYQKSSFPRAQDELITAESRNKQPALCIRGGGFPGFFFTFGQLQSLREASSYDYYCYSAGCLCAVAVLADLPFEQVMGLAANAQDKWKRGEISRFQLVPHFVDEMIDQILLLAQKAEKASTTVVLDSNLTNMVVDSQPPLTRPNATTTDHDNKYWWLHSLRIVTGRLNDGAKGGALAASFRSPAELIDNDLVSTSSIKYSTSSKSEPKSSWTKTLREMLIQTTWIPGITGNDLFLENHLDGGFVFGQMRHKCDRILEAPWTWELLVNTFNTNLSREQALYFWKAGLEHGRQNLLV
ncbi:hypothetical protein ACA910_016126 [Epithemia clementina (nom. ined.)]